MSGHRPTALERAFELARSGAYAKAAEIKRQLKIEGFHQEQVAGPTLSRQLTALCTEARRQQQAPAPE